MRGVSPSPSASTLDFGTIGRRIRIRRQKFGMSIDALAERAGVARYTVIRIEQGKPSTRRTLQKVRRALRLFTDQMTRPLPENEDFVVNRGSELQWNVSIPKEQYQKRLLDDDPIHVNDLEERRRLGAIGFQPFFTSVFESELPNGVTGQALMELYRPSWVDRHYGEEFIYCLRGQAKITVNGTPCILDAGDSLCFDANLPHQYEPAEPIPPEGEPTLILIVVALRPGEKKSTPSE